MDLVLTMAVQSLAPPVGTLCQFRVTPSPLPMLLGMETTLLVNQKKLKRYSVS